MNDRGVIVVNNGQKEKHLTPAKSRFVAAMLTERDIARAATKAGITIRTGYRWARLPEIQDALKNATSGALEDTMRRLVGLGELALDALQSVLQDSEATHHEKIRAADIILSKILVWSELVDLEDRISELERRASDD